MNSIKRKKIRIFACLGFVIVLALTALTPAASTEVQAAKKVTTKYNWKKASTVKKGTTTIVSKPLKNSYGGQENIVLPGFIKFEAPKKGTYRFTISNIVRKTKGKGAAELICPRCKVKNIAVKVDDDYTEEDVVFWTGDGSSNSIWPDKKLKVKTEGGKSSRLYLATESHIHGRITTDDTLTSRTATVKLSKGQVVYMGFVGVVKSTCTLKIKKI